MNCNFGPYLTSALRDQFVGGVRSQTTKKKLFSEYRTFDQALKVAQADELAEKESKLLQGNSDTSGAGILPVKAVHKKSFPAQQSQRQTDPKSKMGGRHCFRCGSPQNLADKCSHVESTCNYCGKPGNLAKACFKKKKEIVVTTPLTKY